jgi:hypothetical protein
MEYQKNFVQTRSLTVAEGTVVEGAWSEGNLSNGNEIIKPRTSVKSAILRLLFSQVPVSWTFF